MDNPNGLTTTDFMILMRNKVMAFAAAGQSVDKTTPTFVLDGNLYVIDADRPNALVAGHDVFTLVPAEIEQEVADMCNELANLDRNLLNRFVQAINAGKMTQLVGEKILYLVQHPDFKPYPHELKDWLYDEDLPVPNIDGNDVEDEDGDEEAWEGWR